MDEGSEEVYIEHWSGGELELKEEDGTYADYEVLGVDEVVPEDCGENGSTKFSCWTCESEHFASSGVCLLGCMVKKVYGHSLCSYDRITNATRSKVRDWIHLCFEVDIGDSGACLP